MQPILEVRDLCVTYINATSRVLACRHIEFDLFPGKTLALLGESGCGKTAVGLALLRLTDHITGAKVSGKILFRGEDILATPNINRFRGKKIAMIFQEPMSALNPVLTVGYQIAETVRAHTELQQRSAVHARVIELMQECGISDAHRIYRCYPHELSGGLRQRVVIALALAGEPEVVVADEPTTALDRSKQKQVADLLRSLQKKKNLALLLITHDIRLAQQLADEIAVLYAGAMVETGVQKKILLAPFHPYTQGLLSCFPQEGTPRGEIPMIPGQVPILQEEHGCAFADRCPTAMPLCRRRVPVLQEIAPHHKAACFRKEGT